MLRSGPPTEPSSPEFAVAIADAGRRFAEAGVIGVYCIHGTFCGNDILGLLTELARYAPSLSASLRRAGKSLVNLVLGETGNYTPGFAARLQQALEAGANAPLPVRLFNWSSLNNHIGRADGAVRLIDELASLAAGLPAAALDSVQTPRIQLWGHSHGGNVMAIVSNLLGADDAALAEFFHAGRSFYCRPASRRVDVPVWHRVEQLLRDRGHPLRSLQLDMVTYGTPVRYGWDNGGFANLMHFSNHRPRRRASLHAAPYPPNPVAHLVGAEGDFVQHLGIAGTNFPPLPIAARTFLADLRLDRLLERDLPARWLGWRLRRGCRIHHEGVSLLIDYEDPSRFPWRHLFGHAAYTRSRWSPLHCRMIADEFYA